MFRAHLVTATVLAVTASTALNAQEGVPAVLDNLKPHEVVEALTSEAKTLGATPDQVRRLDSLHIAVRDERHRWVRTPSNKAHKPVKMRPMISADSAYRQALTLLTPEQRSALARRFDDTTFVPVVPSLAGEVPPSLENLKPHEIPQAFVAERERLGLGDTQVQDLQALHVAIRDEPPLPHGSVGAGRGQHLPLLEPDRRDGPPVPLGAEDFLPPCQLPDAHGSIPAAGGQPLRHRAPSRCSGREEAGCSRQIPTAPSGRPPSGPIA